LKCRAGKPSEQAKNTVRKVMLSAVTGDGQKEELAPQAAPVLD